MPIKGKHKRQYSMSLQIPSFDIQKEAEDVCSLCTISVPADLHFIQPIFIGDSYRDLCPKCALGVRNLLKGYPKTAKYADDEANRIYFQFISWMTQMEKGE